MANTIQSGIKSHTKDDLTNYALFMGGTNVIHEVLSCYDPLKTGYGRLFMVRKPIFLESTIPSKLKKFKHILEYGNTAVSGLNDVSVNFESITGGYAGNSFEIPTYAQDGTTSISITVYEFSGSPIREVVHSWINGSTDLITGLCTFNGASSNIARIQANQTAEFIFVNTDHTGEAVEYACLLANCFPKSINTDAFNYSAGEHKLVETTIDFTCTKYESIQINKVATALIKKYKVLANSMNFYSGYKSSTVGIENAFGYDIATGKLTEAAHSQNTNTPQPVTAWDRN